MTPSDRAKEIVATMTPREGMAYYIPDKALVDRIALALQQERDRTIEECAKVAEDIREDYLPQHSLETRSACREISTAIRSLSKGRGI